MFVVRFAEKGNKCGRRDCSVKSGGVKSCARLPCSVAFRLMLVCVGGVSAWRWWGVGVLRV